MRPSYIAMPSISIPSANVIQALLVTSPKKNSNYHKLQANRQLFSRPSFWLGLLATCLCLSLIKLILLWHPLDDSCGTALYLSHLSSKGKSTTSSGKSESSKTNTNSGYGVLALDHQSSDLTDKPPDMKRFFPASKNGDFIAAFPPHALHKNMSDDEKQFWKQPESLGFKPCLSLSSNYRDESKRIAQGKKKYLMVIVSGGLNQQRNQIVDAVVIARILGAALVVPILQVNQIWKDQSEFSDIFDVDHFKSALKDDVQVVSSLPSTHIMTRPVHEKSTPLDASPQWFHSNYQKRLNREGVLLLRGMDGRLSKDLPIDLQKLRCKVGFHALRFKEPLLEIGHRLAQRMWEHGPYVALHLRLEKDVWVRTGCLPGLGHEFDKEIRQARIENPRLLTGRSNMTYSERKLAGLCPLNAAEVARLLKGLGASKETRIFWAGGEPFGGLLALKPLIEKFPNFYNKKDLAFPGELEPFINKASSLAAIDYLISLHSDVFMPSHGGNMARALQGHRAYAGFRKHITPNKREMLPYFFQSPAGSDVDVIIRNLHDESSGQPVLRTQKPGRDVLAYPAPECMCAGSVVMNGLQSS